VNSTRTEVSGRGRVFQFCFVSWNRSCKLQYRLSSFGNVGTSTMPVHRLGSLISLFGNTFASSKTFVTGK
jgi:hypothetical protein